MSPTYVPLFPPRGHVWIMIINRQEHVYIWTKVDSDGSPNHSTLMPPAGSISMFLQGISVPFAFKRENLLAISQQAAKA